MAPTGSKNPVHPDSVGRVIAVSAPRRVRSRLSAAPDGPVPIVHQGIDAIYLAIGGGVVGVIGIAAVAVPCALRTTLARLPPTRSAAVRDGVLHLDGTPLRIGRIVDVAVPRLTVPVRATAAATPPGDVRSMIGRGDGLTPYQDDVLCGWLAVHRAARVPTPDVDAAVRSGLHRTTTLSAALLDSALHGEAIPHFTAWLTALDTVEAPRRAAALAAVGHSSGRGLLEGGRAALSQIASLEEVA